MKIEIKVPPVGESVSEAVVSRIIQSAGSVVARDAEVLELETDKVNQVVYAPDAGQISWSVKVGDTVKIGQAIGAIDTDVKAAAAAAPQAPAPVPVSAPVPTPAGPSSRKTSAEFVSELKAPASVSAPAAAPVKTGSQRKRMSSLRKTIAQKLVEVKNTTAMLTSFNEADMGRIIEIRAKEKEGFEKKYGTRLGFMSFFVKAAVAALKEFPDVAATIEGDELVYPTAYDIGVAVSTDRGLMVPVLRDCDALTFGDIEKQLADAAGQARSGTISIDKLRGGCFTITNGGVFGSLLSTPILNPPQSAILGMHTIVKRPVAIDDQIVIRPMMYLALSYDHRVIDGKQAVQFLVHMRGSLEDPTRLLLDL